MDAESHGPDGRTSPQTDARQPLLSPHVSKQTPYLPIAVAMYSFAVLGLFTSTTGVIIPYLEDDFGLNDAQASVIFLMGLLGYILAAQLNETIHMRFGRRGIAILGPIFLLLSASVAASSRSFLAFLSAFALGALGIGLIDGSWCAWAGAMERANLISGLLHSSFSVGAGCAPLLIQLIVHDRGVSWKQWYYVLAAFSLFAAVALPFAFRNETAVKYQQRMQEEDEYEPVSYKRLLGSSAVWVCSLFLLFYVGTELVISGWVVSYMSRARHATERLSNVSASAFWIGTAVGRVLLGTVTDRIGLDAGVTMYLYCAQALQVLFIVLPEPRVSAVLIALIGFCCGPLFPSAIVKLTKLLPREMHISAVSLVASIGQVGAAFLPFGLGTVSNWLGIGIFPAMVLGQLIICLLVWRGILRINPAQTISG